MKQPLVETVKVDIPPGEAVCTYDNKSGKKPFYRGGYAHTKKWGPFLFSLFNRVLALGIFLVCLPIFIVVSILLWCYQGLPLFYRGTRLGLNKKPFYMLKFRTLPTGMQKVLQSDMISTRKVSLSPFITLLRDTRLDELPQLINIIKGEMEFVGPRPIRPEIYESVCQSIRSYDLRFAVKPGLIGFSQLFTPHSTPKRLRSIIDNHFIRLERKFYWDFFIVFYTGGLLLRAVVVKSWLMFYRQFILQKMLGKYQEKRTFERLRPEDARFLIECKNEQGLSVCETYRIEDINDDYCRIITDRPLENQELHFSLAGKFRNPGSKKYKQKTVRCKGTPFKHIPNSDPNYPHIYIIRYQPLSSFYQYLLEKYFLRKSIIELATSP